MKTYENLFYGMLKSRIVTGQNVLCQVILLTQRYFLLRQNDNANSVFFVYKKLIQVRKGSTALYGGALQNLDMGNKSILGYTRISNSQTALVLHNVGKEKVLVDLPRKFTSYTNVLFKMRAKTNSSGQIDLSSNGTIILSK